MIKSCEFKYLIPEWVCRERRTALFLKVTGLKSTGTQSKAREKLLAKIGHHMTLDHVTYLELNSELFILNEPYHDHIEGERGLINDGLSVIKVPVNLSPYCGYFSDAKGALPRTTSYLISAKPTMTSAAITERL
jgi:hypothetical protein